MELTAGTRSISFGDFQLDLQTAELRRDGESLGLQPLPSRLLVLLAERAGSLVERDVLRRELWGESWLDWEAGLHQAISQIRAVLGDSASEPRFVETVPRRGYRFVAAVEKGSVTPPAAPHEAVVLIAGATSRRSWLIAAAALVMGIFTVVWAASPNNPVDDRIDVISRPAEAERLYREGLHLLSERRPDEAADRLERAAQEATDWAEPWSALAEMYLAMPTPDRVTRAREALEAALARDAENVRAWRQLAQLRLWEEWDWAGARLALEKAVTLDPGSAEVWQLVAALETVLGNASAAIEAARRAVYLDPVSTALQVDLGWTLYYTGNAGDAAAECRRTLELASDNASARQCLVQALWVDGRRTEATAYLTSAGLDSQSESVPGRTVDEYFKRQLQALEQDPTCSSSAAAALPKLALGDKDGAFEALLQGARERHGWEVPFARVDPLFADLRSDSRFAEVVALLGIS